MGNSAQSEVIDSVFDDPWDEKLENINDEESDESGQDPPSVFNKIILKSLKRLHSLLPFLTLKFNKPAFLKSTLPPSGVNARSWQESTLSSAFASP